MTRTGETAGMLEESLERIADQLEKRDSLRRQVRAAMAYPMMIGVFALVLLALVAFLIPVFEEVFKDFNGELPTITQISVGMSHFVTGQWYLLIGRHRRPVFGVPEVEGGAPGAAASGTPSS